jgi:hypothetical protein
VGECFGGVGRKCSCGGNGNGQCKGKGKGKGNGQLATGNWQLTTDDKKNAWGAKFDSVRRYLNNLLLNNLDEVGESSRVEI